MRRQMKRINEYLADKIKEADKQAEEASGRTRDGEQASGEPIVTGQGAEVSAPHVQDQDDARRDAWRGDTMMGEQDIVYEDPIQDDEQPAAKKIKTTAEESQGRRE